MRVVAVSLLLLLPIAAASPYTGSERMLSDGPVELTPATAGDGFVAWSDSRRGVSDVYIRPLGDDVFRLTRSDPNRESSFHPAADGRWVAWVRSSEATPDPSEESGTWSREYVVYDVARQARVYESGTASHDEDRLVVAGDRLGFLRTPPDGGAVFTLVDLTGPQAFVERVPLDTSPHSQPTLSTSHAAFMELHEDAWRIVAVDLADMSVRVVAEEPGVGYLDPTLDGSMLAWVEYRDREPTLRVVDLAGGEDLRIAPPAREIHRIDLRGDLLVAEARNETRFLLAACLGDGTMESLPGPNPVRSFPVLTPWDSVMYVAAVQGEPYLWEMPVSCSPPDTDGAAESPGLGWLGILAALGLSRRVPLHVGRRVRR